MSTPTNNDSTENLLDTNPSPSKPNIKSLQNKLKLNLRTPLTGGVRPLSLALCKEEALQTDANAEDHDVDSDNTAGGMTTLRIEPKPKKLSFVKRTKAQAGRALPARWKKRTAKVQEQLIPLDEDKIDENRRDKPPSGHNSGAVNNFVPICIIICITVVTLLMLYLIVTRLD